MGHENGNMRVQVDGYTRVCLTVIAVLLAVLIVGLWAEAVPSARPVSAAPPDTFGDPNKQRIELVAEMKKTNDQIAELVALFRSGEAKVQVSGEAGEKPAAQGAAKNVVQKRASKE
ncbi:MAG TPA: hypothetical protein DCX07_05955 [Phycisphaerales bacterium]|nr:hypothetical protein [Phycisphaerales bacterium]